MGMVLPSYACNKCTSLQGKPIQNFGRWVICYIQPRVAGSAIEATRINKYCSRICPIQIDFGHRAVHLSATFAKAITRSYYGKRPMYNYWMGCSSGGKQGKCSVSNIELGSICARGPQE